jgi:glycosyltransferase involved in cell wall biosynthesis
LLEAMATGLPSVTTDAGSIHEAIEHGVEGLIVPQNDAVALADALERLMADPATMADMGRRARARFEREFDSRVTEQRLHRRIREILREPRRAPRI